MFVLLLCIARTFSEVHPVKTVGSVTDELEEMQNGLNDILDYVMDMLKQRIQDQIDGLEDMKDAYHRRSDSDNFGGLRDEG